MGETKTLVIMRGVTGSGKSTVALAVAQGDKSKIFSTDDFFVKDGVYQFDPKQIGRAHQWNQVCLVLDIESFSFSNEQSRRWTKD